MESSAVESLLSTRAGGATAKSPKKQLKAQGSPKARSKRQGSKAAKNHPSYSQMVKEAIVALKDRKGSSRVAILKYISGRYQLGDNGKRIHSQLRLAIKKGITSGKFALAKGAGVNGSFKLGAKIEKKSKESDKRKKKVPKEGKKSKVSAPKKPSKKVATAKKSPKRKMKTSKPKPKVSKPAKTAS